MRQVHAILKLLLPECDGNRQNHQVFPLITHNIRCRIRNNPNHSMPPFFTPFPFPALSLSLPWYPSFRFRFPSVRPRPFPSIPLSASGSLLSVPICAAIKDPAANNVASNLQRYAAESVQKTLWSLTLAAFACLLIIRMLIKNWQAN